MVLNFNNQGYYYYYYYNIIPRINLLNLYISSYKKKAEKSYFFVIHLFDVTFIFISCRSTQFSVYPGDACVVIYVESCELTSPGCDGSGETSLLVNNLQLAVFIINEPCHINYSVVIMNSHRVKQNAMGIYHISTVFKQFVKFFLLGLVYLFQCIQFQLFNSRMAV